MCCEQGFILNTVLTLVRYNCLSIDHFIGKSFDQLVQFMCPDSNFRTKITAFTQRLTQSTLQKPTQPYPTYGRGYEQ